MRRPRTPAIPTAPTADPVLPRSLVQRLIEGFQIPLGGEVPANQQPESQPAAPSQLEPPPEVNFHPGPASFFLKVVAGPPICLGVARF